MNTLRRWGRKIRSGYRRVIDYASYAWTFLPHPGPVIEQLPGAEDLAGATRIAVFSHYDKDGEVRAYVRHYVRELREAGCSIVFVTTGPRMSGDTLAWLTENCALIIRRRNVGLDFGSYRDGLRAIPDLSRLERLVLANDSVYGPFTNLATIVDKMDFGAIDAWGTTDSWERRYHIQSYFIVFGSRALRSDAFRRFWNGVRDVRSKRFIITNYEVGLTRALMKAGLRARAVYPCRAAAEAFVRDVRERNILNDRSLSVPERTYLRQLFGLIIHGVPVNTIHFFWEYLIREMGCPFMKRELLRDNPGQIPFLQYWERVISESSDYDTDLIIQDLEVSLHNRSI